MASKTNSMIRVFFFIDSVLTLTVTFDHQEFNNFQSIEIVKSVINQRKIDVY